MLSFASVSSRSTRATSRSRIVGHWAGHATNVLVCNLHKATHLKMEL